MAISSRTPDGTPIDCPLCGAQVRIVPSAESFDVPCPACGHLLWVDVSDGVAQRVFTTGEAARICKVSLQTIVRCFDAGHLKGFRTASAQRRRIPRHSLIEFMIDHGIPVPEF